MTYDNSPREPRTRVSQVHAPDDTRADRPARTWMLVVGVALLAAGLLGFVGNPLVGPDGLFRTGTMHNVVHIVTGLLALGVAALRGRALGQGTIAYGVLYGAVLLLTLASPDLFGILDMPVNAADHLLHAILAVGSLALGYTALDRTASAA